MDSINWDEAAAIAIGAALLALLVFGVWRGRDAKGKAPGDDWGGDLFGPGAGLAASWTVRVSLRSERSLRWEASLKREQLRADAEFAAAFPNWRYV